MGFWKLKVNHHPHNTSLPTKPHFLIFPKLQTKYSNKWSYRDHFNSNHYKITTEREWVRGRRPWKHWSSQETFRGLDMLLQEEKRYADLEVAYKHKWCLHRGNRMRESWLVMWRWTVRNFRKQVSGSTGCLLQGEMTQRLCGFTSAYTWA